MKRLAIIALLAAFIVAACGDTSGPLATDDPSASAPGGTPTPASGTPTPDPTPLESAPPTDDPTGSPAATPAPTPVATADPSASLDPSATPPAPSEAACTGNDGNRSFFADAAAVMSWAVYCAALPSGWVVQTGSFRQANGGFLEISYKGPGGRTLALREGAFCGTPDGCVPDGTDVGDGFFGDKAGALVSANDGSWAVVVDRAANPSWLAVGTGMDQAEFLALSGAIHRVSP